MMLLLALEEGVAAVLYEVSIGELSSLRLQSEWPVESVGDTLSALAAEAAAHGLTEVPSEPNERSAFASRVNALVRARGRGRVFA